MTPDPEQVSSPADALELTFDDIYRRGLWGSHASSPYYSGVGSHKPNIVGPYVDAVRSFFSTTMRDADAVDLGCGDFNVGSQLRDLFRRMTACDIVGGLLEHNRSRFTEPGLEFVKLDIVRDKLPEGRVAFLRQVLQHLSNESIGRVIEKLRAYQYLVITEQVPFDLYFEPNMDKRDGVDIRPDHGSGVVLTAAPFLLNVRSEQRLCEIADGIGLITTMAYRLW
ncbi:class I SAM-dependent methyltransferase [Luteibacter sahnii]|uniref:class I SAM-dependent methyltransferase n=1 Tax=Luteibacter sahnii TaxID=3021977 RepID=UPI002A6A025F|nr:class I SAM-dependent methyltransferase [Luteibacter sp. PPL193]MDY1550010.1 class I SAM-dependent methyltransferase [Luteibacter sp. PPL193]